MMIEVAPLAPWNQGAPVINGPAVYGATPGRPFLYALPVRGERPLHFTAETPLPPGLTLDPEQGWITGRAEAAGEYPVTVAVRNRCGGARKKIRLVLGEGKLCLTPLLGWSSWNACVDSVDQAAVTRTADALVRTGLAARGYAYVNIDSSWQGNRGGEFNALLPNEKFPAMADLVAYLHRLGLKAGIYSTPMVQAWGAINRRFLPGSTGYPLDPNWFHPFYGGCGKVSFEGNDARQFAAWGFDYLKYDWPVCDIPHTQTMRNALEETGRDFIFSLTTSCSPALYPEYRKAAQLLRANGDTRARWDCILANGFTLSDPWTQLVKPGCWYDMDMLSLGPMAMNSTEALWENRQAASDHLTRDEMITQMSIWALFPSPLQISCALERANDFELSLFGNEEMLAINQDELGHCAVCVEELKRGATHTRIYRRKLAGNSEAVGFFNLGTTPAKLELPLPSKNVSVRDVWALKTLPVPDSALTRELPPHGASVFRLEGME